MKIWQTRMQQKHDIPANWEKSSLVPLAGEIIVYDVDPAEYENNKDAPAARYKIGDGIRLANDLPFADAAEVLSKLNEIAGRIEDIASGGGLSALRPVDGTIVLESTTDGGKSIGVAIAPVEGNALTAVEGGLFVQQLSANEGIKITDNKISVKLADTTHGLVAVNGELKLNLATKTSDGAMSKEDKRIIDSLPEVYVQRKYEVSDKPVGTLVDYRGKEIRIMCPADTEWTIQNSGANASKNKYYIGFKAYAPEGAISFKEDTAKVINDNTMQYFERNDFAGIDEYSRKYSIIWLPVAELVNGSWNYYGASSTKAKYLGWYYTVEWYSEGGTVISSETVRINLSNETCHNNINTFYGADEDVTTKVEAIENNLNKLQEYHCWGEML